MSSPALPLPIRFDENGLVPAVIVDDRSDMVLMLGFMNAEAFDKTRETGRVHFFSRSRKRLWKKGESSGNELVVTEIRVNCEENSLMVRVDPIGPTCHEGYQSCYHRRLEPDNALTVIDERWSDPSEMYATKGNDLAGLTRTWLGAYVHLKGHDLSAVSGTSRRLREAGGIGHRVADELVELAGVLDGSHVHGNQAGDALLEGSQVLYWLAMTAVHAGLGWDDVRPDRALVATDERASPRVMATTLRAEANGWSDARDIDPNLAARCHAAMHLVGQAVAVLGIEPVALVERDLADMRSRGYMAAYFASVDA